MNLRQAYKTAALGLLMLPLMGGTCTKDKVIALIIDGDMIGVFQAEGIINVHSDSDTITSLRAELDLDKAAEDAGVDIDAIDASSLKVKSVSYQVVVPQAGRTLTNARILAAGSGGGLPSVVATGFTVDASTAAGWIDLHPYLQDSGIQFLNDLMKQVVEEMQADNPAADGIGLSYSVSGNSVPADIRSDFVWSIKVEMTGLVKEEFTLPDF